MSIYLDANATTKLYPGLIKSASRLVEDVYGNPSSVHGAGYAAKSIIDTARFNVARSLSCKADEIIFTSGGTEANNIACKSFGDKTYSTALEHSSVIMNSCNVKIPTNSDGMLDLPLFEKKLESGEYQDVDKSVFSIMMANNETGVILDPRGALKSLKEKFGFILHIDAVSAFGKGLPNCNPESLGADLMTISGHKIHALKGVGALFISERIKGIAKPLSLGGNHEFGFRAGTENIMGIYTLGEMCSKLEMDKSHKNSIIKMALLRDLFEHLLEDISEVNGNRECRISNTSNLYFKQVTDLELFLSLLNDNGIYASGMSACQSGLTMPSRILSVMYGADSIRLSGSVRFSISTFTKESEIREAAFKIKEVLEKIKKLEL